MSAKSLQVRIPQHIEGPGQRRVLELIATGAKTRDIASAMKISAKTVEAHRTRLMRRVDLWSYQELTKLALRIGLAEIDV